MLLFGIFVTMFYLVRTPFWLRALYPSFLWRVNTKEPVLYLTFDDGPHPTATPFVLDQLKRYNAKATFFCLGKNVQAEPEIYRRIIEEGHAIGNHTFDHLNGWKTDDEEYLLNVRKASEYIDSQLFRPPYGKIGRFQSKLIREQLKMRIVMWDVLSGDFDVELTKEKCRDHVILNASPGSVIVFHDSEKAWSRMEFALSEVLKYFSAKGYRFEILN